MSDGKHEWYGPEYYREPLTHAAAAIQRPLTPNSDRWINGVINGYLRDCNVTRPARKKDTPHE